MSTGADVDGNPFDLGAVPAAEHTEPVAGRVLRLDGGALLAVPAGPAGPRPLLVFFHGSGGTPQQSLSLTHEAAERAGVAVLAPRSVDRSWDLVTGEPGPDVAALRRSLAAAARHVRTDPAALALGGFSDGASYALTLGLANPGTVGAVLAFSPGFFAGRAAGAPRCFVSHGRADRVLPPGRTSARIVPLLRRAGHEVEFAEFDGGHEVPGWAVERALSSWLGSG